MNEKIQTLTIDNLILK